jgi:CRISPR-associated protein Cas2
VVVTYVIVVYDMGVERLDNVRKYLRQYLDWIQNSVFEGSVTKATLREIENGLKGLIDPELDSIIIFVLRDEKFLERRYIGEPKVELTNIL